ncbi:MAG: preprotein translocase subunit SecG [Nitrospirae bacterium]|nr:preprotein translocase subunit SecG [Nitrospirota bacterium]
MTILLIIVHVFVCLFLIAVVLLQSGKGAEMGAAFGGSSQTLFGSRGAATFLGKMTTIVAIVFMLTSLILAIVTSKGTSVIKKTAVPQQTIPAPVPVAPVQGGNVQQPMQPTKQQQPAQAPVAKQPVQPSQPAQTK